MAATRKTTKKAPAVVATISKLDAFNLVKSGEVDRENKFRRPCHLCGEIVDAGAGVLGGNKTEGWWAAHKGGECFTPEPAKKTTRKRTTAAKESASASKKVAAESESAAMVDEPSVPVRGGKRNSTMAAAKKTVARRTTRKAAPAPTTATKRPAKRTAPKKVEPNKPVEVADESASDEDEGPEFAELDTAAQTLVTAFIERIKDGTLDGALAMLDDAIGERLDAVEAASKPAPKKTARKSTTTAKSAAEKVAPVKRAAKGAGSASASKPSDTEEVEIVKVPKPVRGRDYRINPKLKNKMAGVKITFKSYVPDTDNKKASVTIREEYNGKPIGSRLAVPTSSIVVDPDA